MGNSKALVTGGCGFIGSNLVDHLKKLNYDVVVVDNLSSGNREYCRNDVEYWHADFQEVLSNGTLDNAGIEVIFHLAAEARIQPSFEDPVYTCKNNSFGTTIVCEFARKNNCRVVYAGSSSILRRRIPQSILVCKVARRRGVQNVLQGLRSQYSNYEIF